MWICEQSSFSSAKFKQCRIVSIVVMDLAGDKEKDDVSGAQRRSEELISVKVADWD
jgi:hypothetical protein